MSAERSTYTLGRNLNVTVTGDLSEEMRSICKVGLHAVMELGETEQSVRNLKDAEAYLRGARFRADAADIWMCVVGSRPNVEYRLDIEDSMCDRISWQLGREPVTVVPCAGRVGVWDVKLTMDITVQEGSEQAVLWQVAALLAAALAWNQHSGSIPIHVPYKTILAGMSVGTVTLGALRPPRTPKPTAVCTRLSGAKYASRPGPPYPAHSCGGLTKKGNDGRMYASVPDKNGVHHWKR